ncbi:MetQ/NlpA family ABC transporter substrate-binding protein [Brachyspira catarrhinii]|uniref:Lipoprotein n=1 Tax=Brachyspira catarrhinii TaxID=2528966 RepID=A0ABY2TRZ5_9SPIR|nr:MetQ/NlpA family ABC transporter substrate-binding protein [Brachyspira catarrhinii]TKZ34523.1 MetQ/NlpA family ABC transporter substrate-binding protein [Brachyspira catarrhinii]
MRLKKSFNKKVLFILVSFTVIFFASCSNTNKDSITVKIGHVGESDRAIWKPVQEKLSKEGINVELVSFADYSIPNQALNDGDIDLNAFQHHAYFYNETNTKGYNLSVLGVTFISAMNIYSQKISNVSEVKNGDKVAIPNDPSNGGRALKVLQAAGLIKLKDNAPNNPEISDIAENPLNLDIVEVEAGSIYSLLPDVACAVINCNYALDFGLNPGKDFIFQDNPKIYDNNMYVNLIAARTEDKDNEVYKKIADAYHSPEVEKVYAEEFKGAYLPAWK